MPLLAPGESLAPARSMSNRPPTRLFAATRSEVFAALLVTATLNAQAGRIVDALAGNLTAAFISLFGINAIVWFACFALMRIGLEARDGGPQEQITRADLGIAIGMALACLLPTPFPAAAALIGGAIWLWRSSPADSGGRRLAIIGLALTGPVIWGPLVLRLLGPQLLWLDAALGAALAGYEASDNLIVTPGARLDLMVADGCSAFRNVTQVLLLATTLFVLLDLRPTLRAGIGIAAAVGAVILINGTRLAAMALYPARFDYLHDGGGATLFGYATLVASVLILGVFLGRSPRHAH